MFERPDFDVTLRLTGQRCTCSRTASCSD